MNQEERNLLQGLFDRLRDGGNQARDPEAERFIAEQIRYQPGAPYYMAQAVIVQEQALQDSQARIAELETRVQELESVGQPRGQGGFLAGRTGGMFSRGAPAPQQASSPASAVPAIGPWGRPSAAPAPQQQGYAQPMQAQQPAASGGGGGFLKGALATAAGVAGGALIYDQMKGMFGGNQQAQANTPSADQAAADQYQDEGQDAQPVDNDDQDFGGGDSSGGDLDI
jgi:uncharacterized protein